MFVNGLPYLTKVSIYIRFGTAEHALSHTAKQLANSLMKVVKLYDKGGFVVRNVLMDDKIEKVNPEISLIELNISAESEHVAEIERFHRTFERTVPICLV